MSIWLPLLPKRELIALWEPRIGPAATQHRLRSQRERRTFGCGGLASIACWSLALVLLQMVQQAWLFLTLTGIALIAFIAFALAGPLLIRSERAAQRAANDYWGLTPVGPHMASVPYDDIGRFDAWRRRHPELQPMRPEQCATTTATPDEGGTRAPGR